MSTERICANFSDNLREIALELFNSDDRAAQRKVSYLVNELPADQRLRGLFKVGSKICMWREILRADLQRRARGEPLPGPAADSLPRVLAEESDLDASADHVHDGDALSAAAEAEAEAAVTAPRAENAP